jgi:hypothetical protein
VSKFALGIEAFLARTIFAASRHCFAALAADKGGSASIAELG